MTTALRLVRSKLTKRNPLLSLPAPASGGQELRIREADRTLIPLTPSVAALSFPSRRILDAARTSARLAHSNATSAIVWRFDRRLAVWLSSTREVTSRNRCRHRSRQATVRAYHSGVKVVRASSIKRRMKNVAALSLTCAMLGLVGQSVDNPGMDLTRPLPCRLAAAARKRSLKQDTV
jgi:hypothetical protein